MKVRCAECNGTGKVKWAFGEVECMCEGGYIDLKIALDRLERQTVNARKLLEMAEKELECIREAMEGHENELEN